MPKPIVAIPTDPPHRFGYAEADRSDTYRPRSSFRSYSTAQPTSGASEVVSSARDCRTASFRATVCFSQNVESSVDCASCRRKNLP